MDGIHATCDLGSRGTVTRILKEPGAAFGNLGCARGSRVPRGTFRVAIVKMTNLELCRVVSPFGIHYLLIRSLSFHPLSIQQLAYVRDFLLE
jgi:hypothetical protein